MHATINPSVVCCFFLTYSMGSECVHGLGGGSNFQGLKITHVTGTVLGHTHGSEIAIL